MARQDTDLSASTESPRPTASSKAARGASFAIVGIGASAGGLEALEQFLARVPVASGLAYVIVQHLDPTHKGMMPELLQRSTAMPVVQARNRLKVKPDHVYVIPPNRDMSILHGTLYLFDPTARRGLRLPIDFFLRSLAQDLRQRAVGVILSGMGSDGSAGLRAIKENAGLAAAQDPASAAFAAMPRSAIDAGLVDIVAPAAELPARILASLSHAPYAGAAEPAIDGQLKSGLEKVLILLRAHNGQDFSLYKKSTLYRRIERRMGVHQIDRIATYVGFLQENPQELELLFREFLIGVTNFFRDPAAWERLRDAALPPLFESCPAGRVLRAWVPGCSTGEEAYSLAMIFKEAIEKCRPAGRFALQIFATDIDSDAIDRARQGHYPGTIAADVTPERLARFFVATNDGFQVSKEIREMVVFAPQNLIQDPPFTKLDLLLCRNLLIYFGTELQKKLLPLFHYSLVPGGVLFLGNSEALGSAMDLFAPLDAKARIFRRIDVPAQAIDIDFPARHRSPPFGEGEAKAPAQANLQALADQLLLRHFAPAAVLVNERGDIVYINGRTGRYLEPAAGRANWNVHVMAREGVRAELGSALHQVTRQRGRIERTDLFMTDDGVTRRVGLVVQMIEEPGPLSGMVMIAFSELPALPEPRQRGGRTPRGAREVMLDRELQQARDEIRTLCEDMQASQEELKSGNEELQSTNEELQSTNEELQTVNIELQSRIDDLSCANDDMQNLLNSTEIATVFLDNRLHVRRFTPLATRVFKLIAADAGRPLSDLATDLDYSALQDDAHEVLRSLQFSEKEIATRDGRWYAVRIMPYRTMDNVIEGVVITFIDISVAKRLEAELRAALAAGAQIAPGTADRNA